MLRSAVEQEIRDLIRKDGRITFAQFMQTCLYSPSGGFYSARDNGINTHFGTSSMTHPVFGALIAQQLKQMWRLLGEPPVFHVIEVGAGDGALAQSIVDACRRLPPDSPRRSAMSLPTMSLDGPSHLTMPLGGLVRPEIGYPQGGRTRPRESNESRPRDFRRSEISLAASCVTS